MIKLSSVLTGLTAALLTFAGSNAVAADTAATTAAADDALELEEVLVTAERVKRNLQKTPQFITAKTGADLKAEGKIRLEDVLQGVVGLTMQNDNIGQDNNIFMRGISNGAAGVSILLDGVAQAIGTQSSAATYRFTTLDLAQVEVARGVQNGAGVSALSGAVSLVSNQPTFDLSASGSVTTGSHNMLNTEGVLNMPITRNQALRLAFSTDRRNAFYSGGLGESDNRAFRLRYRWQPRDTLDIGVSFQESRVGGASNGASGTLFTGHWATLSAGTVFNYANPYSGATSSWGQTVPSVPAVAPATGTLARNIYLTGNVLAAGTGGANANPAISTVNTNLASNGQYYYQAPACVANALFSGGVTSTFNTPALLQTALGALGPASAIWGCPYNAFSIRDGVDWYNRSDPWNDSFTPNLWINTPSFKALNRQANVTIDWETRFGSVQLQPSLLFANSYLVEPARGTGWMEGGAPSTKSYRFDSSFTSKMIGSFQYVLGLNANATSAAEDGLPTGANARVVSAALQPWATANPLPTPTNGVTPNGGVVSNINTNCYYALPSLVSATARGVANNTACSSGSYLVGTGSRSYSLTADLRYTLWEKLQLNGVIRYDNSQTQTRNAAPGFLVDADGQRYVWVLPQSTIAAAPAPAATITGNPNSPYYLPYRMNLSGADLQAIADAYPVFKRSYSDTTFTLNLQYDFTPSISGYTRLATGTTASMTPNISALTASSYLLSLPDAKVPVFSGNATAAAVARSNLPYQMVVTPPPSDTTSLLSGEQTRQITLGLKSRWLDNKLQFNVEAFYNKFTNRALSNIIGAFPTDVNSPTNATASQVCNAPATSPTASIPFVIVLDPAGTSAARGASCFNMIQTLYNGRLLTKGVDVDLTWVPTANDRLDLTAEWLRTSLNGYDPLPTVDAAYLRPYVVSGTNDAILNFYAGYINGILNDTVPRVVGFQLANAPKLTINTTYQHRFSLPSGASITPRLQYNYTAAKFISSGGGGNPTTDNNTILDSNWAIDNNVRLPTVVPSSGIWNFFVSFQPANAKWYVNAYVNNVRNKAILNSAFNLATYSTGSRATNDLQRVAIGGNATLAAPRVFGLTISASL